MTIIGITGGSGAGKTTALGVLAQLGAYVIDCDQVYHRLLDTCEPMLTELEAQFPGTVMAGKLQRKVLGRIVFQDSEALAALNRVTHRHVAREVDDLLARWADQGGTLAAIDAIALLESEIRTRCDLVVGVVAPVEMRVARLIDREGISEDYARTRIGGQKPDSYFRQHCDIILENNSSDLAEFKEKCHSLFSRLLDGQQKERDNGDKP